MTVTLTELNATAIYQIPVTICPMHYYGETDKYDYANNKFGFDKGDLSHVKSVTSAPVGSGPYTFESYSNGAVTLQKNATYWKGEPKIDTVIWREIQDVDESPASFPAPSTSPIPPTPLRLPSRSRRPTPTARSPVTFCRPIWWPTWATATSASTPTV